MSGLFKRRMAPEGATRFVLGADIAAPAEAVYALLDWSSPVNAKRQLGHSVMALGAAGDRFRMIMTSMPDHCFDFRVTQARHPLIYEFESEILPRVGRLCGESEHYGIEHVGENACRVTLTVDADFGTGLNMREFRHESETMTLACLQGLTKLKIHAEQGADAVRMLESTQGTAAAV